MHPDATNHSETTGHGPMFDAAARVLASQPFNENVGTRLVSIAEGSAELEIPVSPGILQQHGYVQGGVLAFLADNALTFAGGSVLGPMVVTRGFSIEFLRPGLGVTVRAAADVTEQTDRTAACQCKLYVISANGEETVCAVAHGMIARISG